jgi:hypothetical protein
MSRYVMPKCAEFDNLIRMEVPARTCPSRVGARSRTRVCPHHPATNWQTAMRINDPGNIISSPGTTPPLLSTAALGPTVDAYRDALAVAANHAATSAALGCLDLELASCRRAIGGRLVLRREQELHELDLHLDQQDREEALRVQVAVNRRAVRARR